jgi:mannose-1-phosphate guanylyltransferase
MKIVIFAGGSGKRLWPLSRKNNPKQFQKLFGNETSLENSFNTINKKFNVEDIYISTGAEFVEEVYKTIPGLPRENLILEPESRDTAAAVAYAMLKISMKFPNEPVVIRWQNSLIKDSQSFVNALDEADKIFANKEANLIYLGVPSKYPNIGVGHIKLGKKLHDLEKAIALYEFDGFKEKPDEKTAEEYHRSGVYAWNPGCYITTPAYMLEQFSLYAPNLSSHISTIAENLGKNNEWQVIKEEFSKFEKVSIDYALWEKLPFDGIKVVFADYDWHYISTWNDLKTALRSGTDLENITSGDVKLMDSKNCLVYNLHGDKIIAAIGLEDIDIIDTKDGILICHSKYSAKVKNLYEDLSQHGELSKYT